jgi:hypothetical protein
MTTRSESDHDSRIRHRPHQPASPRHHPHARHLERPTMSTFEIIIAIEVGIIALCRILGR